MEEKVLGENVDADPRTVPLDDFVEMYVGDRAPGCQ